MQISGIAIDGAAEIWYHYERNLGSGVRRKGRRVEGIAPYWRGRVALQRDRGRDRARPSPSAAERDLKPLPRKQRNKRPNNETERNKAMKLKMKSLFRNIPRGGGISPR